MASIPTVTLLNTFDEWRTRTNQIITKVEQIEANTLLFVSNNSTLDIRTGANVIFIGVANTFNISNNLTVNSAIRVGQAGSILLSNGNIALANSLNATNLTSNNIVSNNMSITGNIAVSNSITVSKNITSSNITVSQQMYVAGNIILNSTSGVLNLL